jgi:phosphoribosylaminoimidazole-succinocarboxamide synthase
MSPNNKPNKKKKKNALKKIFNLNYFHKNMQALTSNSFQFKGQTKVYNGKVRDVYTLENGLLVMVASDRISAFDHILPKGIPFKGQVLNQVATLFLDATRDIVPNWLLATPDPSVAIGYACEPIRIEMVIRGYLAGHAAREYKAGKRLLCGVALPEGLKENDRLPAPIITPATKAEEGHDEDISREDILARGLVAPEIYTQMEAYTRALFERGTQMAAARGLILVDTKYEFGLRNGEVVLIDEIHTPDSSRYFYADGYEERQAKAEPQKQLSKEFVRQWLIENGFQGLEGQQMPDMPDEFVQTISERYIELFERITGQDFQKAATSDIVSRIEQNVNAYLEKL